MIIVDLKYNNIFNKSLQDFNDAAVADNHIPIGLTHGILDKAGNIIGSISCESIPMLSVWLDSKKATPRDCLKALTKAQTLPKSNSFIVPCAKDSPFYQHMITRFNCLNLGDTTMFLKTKNT